MTVAARRNLMELITDHLDQKNSRDQPRCGVCRGAYEAGGRGVVWASVMAAPEPWPSAGFAKQLCPPAPRVFI